MPNTTWKDNHGRDWSARVTLAEANRLRSDGFDLLDAESLKALTADPFKVVELIAAVHAEQCEAAGMTRADFAEVCTETEAVAIAAADALVEALADFFTRLRKPALAAVVRKAMQAATTVEANSTDMINQHGDAALEQVIREANQKVETALANLSRGPTSGGSLQS